MKLQQYLDNLPSLDNKKIIITGSNSGVGFECAKHVLSKNGILVMACRSETRANTAKEELLKLYPNANISIVIYDQSSLESTKNLALTILKEHSDFYGLLLNAGIYHPGDCKPSVDGYSMTIATNFYANYVLLNELKTFLDETNEEKRIVIQGSLSSRLPIKKINLGEKFNSQFHEYALSKYALTNLFLSLARENKNINTKYMLCEPGITSSNIIRGLPKIIQGLGTAFLKAFMMPTSIASLTAFTAISSSAAKNNDVYLPSGFFRINGYPKVFKIQRKYISNKYNKEVKELIK